jgi:RNA polymerase sigma factor (sigma-70 family)
MQILTNKISFSMPRPKKSMQAVLIAPDEHSPNRIQLVESFKHYKQRLGNFIAQRVANRSDAEDLLQDVFLELSRATNMQVPIQSVPAWLYRVTRNKITDLYRKKKTALMDSMVIQHADDDEPLLLADLIKGDDGPKNSFDRSVIMEAIEKALAELPRDQREVFLMHEVEEMSFNDISAVTGIGINTLLSRKRYAVLYLRSRLQHIYNEMMND